MERASEVEASISQCAAAVEDAHGRCAVLKSKRDAAIDAGEMTVAEGVDEEIEVLEKAAKRYADRLAVLRSDLEQAKAEDTAARCAAAAAHGQRLVARLKAAQVAYTRSAKKLAQDIEEIALIDAALVRINASLYHAGHAHLMLPTSVSDRRQPDEHVPAEYKQVRVYVGPVSSELLPGHQGYHPARAKEYIPPQPSHYEIHQQLVPGTGIHRAGQQFPPIPTVAFLPAVRWDEPDHWKPGQKPNEGEVCKLAATPKEVKGG